MAFQRFNAFSSELNDIQTHILLNDPFAGWRKEDEVVFTITNIKLKVVK